MTAPEEVPLRWDHGVADGEVRSAYARVTLTSPIADPSEEPIVIFLDINPDGDAFQWTAFFVDEEGVDRAEIGRGTTVDLEEAMKESWVRVCGFLTSLGYADDEITRSISQPAGSLILDLDEGYDDDE